MMFGSLFMETLNLNFTIFLHQKADDHSIHQTDVTEQLAKH